MPLEIPFLHGSNDNNFSKYYIYQRLARNNLVYLYIYIYIEDELKLIERGMEAIFED